MATLDSNKVTSVSVVSGTTDAVNRQYLDDNALPSTTGNVGRFLSTYAPNVTINYPIVTGTTTGITRTRGLVYESSIPLYVYSASSNVVATSTDAITWILRTAAGGSSDLLTYHNGFFVLHNTSNVIQTSTNAITWTLRTTSLVFTARAITSGGGKYLVGGWGGSVGGIDISTDAINWTTTIFQSALSIESLAYKNNLYIAGDAATPAKILVSTDATVWTFRTSGSSIQFNDFDYFKNTYISIGDTGQLTTSTDTIVWITRTSGTIANLESIVSTNDYAYVVGASGTLINSTDTITWTLRTSGFGTSSIGSIQIGNNILFYAGATGTMRVVPLSSTITKVWSSINSTSSSPIISTYKGSQEFTATGAQTFYIPPTATQFYIEAIGGGGGGASGRPTGTIGSGGGGGSGAYNAWLIRRGELGSASTMTVTVGAGGRGGGNRGMSTSTDGIVWTHVQRGSGFGSSIIYTLMYDGTNYFAGGAGGTLTTSTDSINWISRTSGRTTQIGTGEGGNKGLLYVSGATEPYLYCGASGVLATSTDSIAWTLRTAASGTTQMNSIIYGSLPTATYVRSVNAAGNIATSTNAIQWTLRTLGVANNPIVLSYTASITERYVSANNGSLSTSTDAITWITRTTPPGSASFRALSFVNNLYLASNGAGIIMVSTNAIEWVLRTSGFGTSAYDFSYGAGLYVVAAAGSGIISTSTDTIVWTLRSTLFGTAAVNALSYGTLLVAGGASSGAGANGSSTTVTWTGNTPTGTATYTLTSAAGSAASQTAVTAGTAGAAAAVTLNPLYVTAGLAGGTGLSAAGTSNSSTQANANQVTGGGGGAFNTNTGGNSTTYYYGNTYTASGGSASGGNGSDGIPGSYTGNIGSGGGGGGSLSTGINSWYVRTAVSGTNPVYSSMYDGSNFFAGSQLSILSVSTDGITWTLRTSGMPESALAGSRPYWFGNLTGGNGLLYAAGQTNAYVYGGGRLGGGGEINNFIGSSTDGIVWTLRTSGYDNSNVSVNAIAFGSLPTATYVWAVNVAGIIGTSTNAIQWTLRTTGEVTNVVQSLLYSTATSEYYVNCRTAGVLQTSTDAIHWTLRTSGTTTALRQLLYGAVYVAAGDSGVLNTSTNAIQWSLRTSGTTEALYGLAYTAGTYVVSGAAGLLRTSTDAIVWIAKTSNTASQLNNITFGNNTYVATMWNGSTNIGGILTASAITQSAVGNGGSGTRGGGGGGGGYSLEQNRFGVGGNGGGGYVRITWW